MQRLSISVAGAIVALLISGAVWAQEETFPEVSQWDGSVVVPEISGVFNVLEATVQDVPWNGTGSVSVPFTINQRATVWLVVYKMGTNETGRRGPGPDGGAWLRLVPQPLYINHTSGQAFQSGQNRITWNGTDFEGTAAGPGTYQFDLIAVNNLDNSSLAAPGPGSGSWTENSIDTRFDPPVVWSHEHFAPQPDLGRLNGDMTRSTLGTDYLANPNAWERWQYNDRVFNYEGASTWGGTKVDDQDPEIFWTNHRVGEMAGIFKMKIDPPAKSWSRVTDFGDNGWAQANEDNRQVGIAPWGNIIYQCNWSRAEPPTTSVTSWDKQTGELMRSYDTNDFFTFVNVDADGNETVGNDGPGKIDVNERGMWLSAWKNRAPIVHMDHDGNAIWANYAGDGLGGRVSNEQAAALGIQPHIGLPIHTRADRSGKVLFMTETETTHGAHFGFFGRDGTALANVVMAPGTGPFRSGPHVWHLNIVSEGGPWDGLYVGTAMKVLTHVFDNPETGELGPGMTMFVPYDVASGRLGGGVTAVEELESSSLPSSYSLDAAYPNPFNPETTISFAVPTDLRVKIDVYNVAGQVVTSLVDEELSKGAYKTTWDALDANGQPVSSGVYFYRMQAGDFGATHSVTLLK